MKMVTFGNVAAALMNALAERPELRDMELNVEINEGREYRAITGFESVYKCHVDTKTGKIVRMVTGMTFKLDWDN